MATEHGARAKALEQQLARMDGIPAALLAAQQALQAALKRESALQAKRYHPPNAAKAQATGRKKEPEECRARPKGHETLKVLLISV
ncbi:MULTISPECIES: hypothetical protein [Rhodanobacter]|uniref:hypothetical protein n=1 Tax=Rhodanobacter TaxID=75309 RepID=UPI0012DEF3B8|nr:MULTISPECIES: hypothetical protein [Rhodanobacter]UJJ52654.1 hypothetical protein LRK52_08240 [Rhodanobacter denitrificans]UJM95407.1 hypothetical protein LRK32_08280 [Rhodanobacter denitrificans]UJM98938.1 hypothetical protein LRK44_08285 [Rhodanobacter denitrificans]UJN21647.1 hypothetical protein LRK54_00215 [Rhodanobacter denitrificans]